MKKKDVLIIADRPGWAYHYKFEFIKNCFNDRYNIYNDYLNYNLKNQKWLSLVHRMYHEKLLLGKRYSNLKKDPHYDMVIFLGFFFPKMMEVNFKAEKKVLGIYTAGFPPANTLPDDISHDGFYRKYLSDCDALVCGNDSIKEYHRRFVDKCYYANSNYDEERFRRIIKKQVNRKKRFVIGWTGDIKRKFKHFHDIINPAVEEAKRVRPGIELKIRIKGALKDLPGFYEDVDVVLIASEKDAGPSLFREAGMMDVPALANISGHPGEVIKEGVNGLLVKDINVNEYAEKIVWLYDHREELYAMSKRIRSDVIRQLGRDVNKRRWERLFKDMLE